MCPRADLGGSGKCRPTGIRSPDRPARSESLYRLSYRGLMFSQYILILSSISPRHWVSVFLTDCPRRTAGSPQKQKATEIT